MINNILIIIIFILIIYILFSTSLFHYKLRCNYKHIPNNNILTLDKPGNYKFFNPSICKYNNIYVMCVRYSNEISKNLFMYLYNLIRRESHICFVILSNNFEIQDTIFPQMKSNNLEDPRICFYNNMFYVSITEVINKQNILPSLYIFDNLFNFKNKIEYDWVEYFKYSDTNTNIQKNFCPFIMNNKLYVHTNAYPIWNVFEIKINSNMKMLNIISFDTTNFFKNLTYSNISIRCSTSWIQFTSQTYLVGLHTKKYDLLSIIPTMRTILVEIDKNTFKPLRKTDILCFDNIHHSRIQFLSGLEIKDDNVYLTFGIGDYKVEIKTLTKDYIISILHPSK